MPVIVAALSEIYIGVTRLKCRGVLDSISRTQPKISPLVLAVALA